jgi:uncharacterized membrane protein
MQQFWEFIFGLERGFLQREGELRMQFNPHWPWQEYLGASIWNVLLIGLALGLVVYVYRREGRTRPVRVALGAMRLLLLGFVILLLNNPVLTLGQSRTEPSVLAVMIDRSLSMRVPDVQIGEDGQLLTRMEAVSRLLYEEDRALLRELSREHIIRFYSFDRTADALGTLGQRGLEGLSDETSSADLRSAANQDGALILEALGAIEAGGQSTQVLQSIQRVLQDLQGQRLAGVVVLTDGRETPPGPISERIEAIRNYGIKLFPVAVGADRAPLNIEVQSVQVQDTAFRGDIVNLRTTVRASGADAGHTVTVVLKDLATDLPLTGPDGRPVQQEVSLGDGEPVEVELHFQPDEVGTLDLVVEAVPQPGEVDEEDNVRVAQVSVLDAQITVLYVDGYPRWEYRYLKNEMIRDETVQISCLLTSADPAFSQEGNIPIRRFPENMDELMEYDVVLFGDVDPRQFTDAQLQMVAEFVAEKGGGFGMVAGPRWAPHAFRNTAIEPILPVTITRVTPHQGIGETITEGFRPVLTATGENSSIFRFFADREENRRYIQDEIPPLFWYLQGASPKPGVGEVLAEHPTATGPDGRKAPILVIGRFGAGRTLFSGIDDSWRWRFYTGEAIFDTYWVQQLRYLARSKKLGQRRMTFAASKPVYELGEQVRLSMRVLDAQLLRQLPERIRVEIRDAEGTAVRQEMLVRQEDQPDLYVASWTADRTGRLTAALPSVAAGVDPIDLPLEVRVPRLEFAQPQVDRTLLTRLASETMGEVVEYPQARERLPAIIPSAAKVIPIETSEPLWDAPLALLIFVMLITAEWVTRKAFGML